MPCPRILLSVLVLVPLLAVAADSGWRDYANGRFGFVLSYPDSLVAGPEPTNGAGREFHSRDGEFSVAASAHFFTPDSGDSLDTRWKEELQVLDGTISYKRKTRTWYVVSGVARDGTEYYHKLYAKGSNWAGFEITYPHARNKKYDPWVSQIAKKFIPFREGDFDRIE